MVVQNLFLLTFEMNKVNVSAWTGEFWGIVFQTLRFVQPKKIFNLA